jgi:hypothetical protein
MVLEGVAAALRQIPTTICDYAGVFFMPLCTALYLSLSMSGGCVVGWGVFVGVFMHVCPCAVFAPPTHSIQCGIIILYSSHLLAARARLDSAWLVSPATIFCIECCWASAQSSIGGMVLNHHI